MTHVGGGVKRPVHQVWRAAHCPRKALTTVGQQSTVCNAATVGQPPTAYQQLTNCRRHAIIPLTRGNTMATISFASSKGGAGKSTSAVLLATDLAQHDTTVTIIDADPNQPVLRWSKKPGKPQNLTVLRAASSIASISVSSVTPPMTVRFWGLPGFLLHRRTGWFGSASIMVTVVSCWARSVASSTADVDFPAPPLELAKEMVAMVFPLVSGMIAWRRQFVN